MDVAGGKGRREVRFRKVEVVGFHPKLDLALVRVDLKAEKLTLKPADVSKAKAVPGQRVYVIGNPGVGATVLTKSITSGMVSAADREVAGEPGRYYQVDAAINPGNSGGPLCDRDGRVLGLITFKFTDAGRRWGSRSRCTTWSCRRRLSCRCPRRSRGRGAGAGTAAQADRFCDMGDLARAPGGAVAERGKVVPTSTPRSATAWRWRHDASNRTSTT